jgi:hypothetical protein
MAQPAIAPITPEASGSAKRRVAPLIVGSIIAVFALVTLFGSAWGLWVDRMDRSGGGFVTIGTSDLRTDTYALQAKLRGDGPRWVYGPTVFGTARIRATSQSNHPLFIGIARTADVARYLDGTGYATIRHLATDEVTTHEGRAQSVPPSRVSIWSASTQGTGEQTLLWKPRSGDWSVVMMNSDASPGVDLHGSLGGKLPILPWLAGGLFLVGACLAGVSALLIVRSGRRRPAAPSETEPRRTTTSTQVPVGTPS